MPPLPGSIRAEGRLSRTILKMEICFAAVGDPLCSIAILLSSYWEVPITLKEAVYSREI
jgi:hypothetical protein